MAMMDSSGFQPVKRKKAARTRNNVTPYDADAGQLFVGSEAMGRAVEEIAPAVDMQLDVQDSEMAPSFEKLTAERQGRMEGKKAGAAGQGGKKTYEMRRIVVAQHRMPQLRRQWDELYTPLVQHLNLQVRMNVRRKMVELRPEPDSGAETTALQKGADFVKAFVLGFEVMDAIALLRLDDLFVESFEIKDVKKLEGDHLARCIGRVSGKDGKTKFAIENATRTRIVIANTFIHILGSFQNIKLARHSICSLILGSPPGKVYSHLRNVSRRVKERL